MSPKPPNLHLVRSDAPPTEGELAELREAVDRMRRNRTLLDAFNREQALFVRSEFLAYVEAGFTRPQAMQLVAAKLHPGSR
ncbi:hypothetical protein BCL79_2760 [Stenotrophomonas rhizophila]|uniref:Uncharacterized protein n=1 Tax=Stenotrophomonas rhizophila TaxID=216778 RepID=A0A498CDA8_9GAMM|nr:hypothetical protein [Stenotrophomonas rhizophila]RLK53453.1 hypothetical protein BCL79_2760 [Stenotrophomonas rhizophila]